MIVPLSPGIARIPHLRAFLRGEPTALAGWGRKPSGIRARQLGHILGIRSLALEDGFLRSVGRSDAALSLIADDIGIYYDAGAPSRLEQMVTAPLTPAEQSRAEALIDLWRAGGVSKYNHAPDYAGPLPDRYVLVVDQTFGDASIAGGLADATSFTRMLDAALTEHADCTIIAKVHPDISVRQKRGHFDVDAISHHPRVQVLADASHPVRLIDHAEAVYAVTSQMGFEALLWGKRVRCFGMPFYAGWGLTDDAIATPARRETATLAQLVHAALIALPRYVDPRSGERCEVETVLQHIAAHRRIVAAAKLND